MNRSLKQMGLTCVLMLAMTANGLGAGEKFAVIDFERVLKDYQKAKSVKSEIEKQKADLQIELERRMKTLKQMEQKYEEAYQETKNKALNEEALKTKLAEAEKRLMEMKEYQMELRKFYEQENRRVFEEHLRMVKKLSAEVQDAVKKYATEKGLLIVIDSSTTMEELRGAVVFRDDSVDITAEITKILNESKTAAKTEAKQ